MCMHEKAADLSPSSTATRFLHHVLRAHRWRKIPDRPAHTHALACFGSCCYRCVHAVVCTCLLVCLFAATTMFCRCTCPRIVYGVSSIWLTPVLSCNSCCDVHTSAVLWEILAVIGIGMHLAASAGTSTYETSFACKQSLNREGLFANASVLLLMRGMVGDMIYVTGSDCARHVENNKAGERCSA